MFVKETDLHFYLIMWVILSFSKLQSKCLHLPKTLGSLLRISYDKVRKNQDLEAKNFASASIFFLT